LGAAPCKRFERAMSQARLYLDEDAMRRSLVFALRARNVDVLSAAEAEMVNRDDQDHLAAAAASGRVLYIQRGGLLCPPSKLDFARTLSRRDHRRATEALLNRRGTSAAHAADREHYCGGDAEPYRIPIRVVLTVGRPVPLSKVNSRMDVQFDKLSNSPVELSSVNGGIELTLPSDAKAEVGASTVSGSIEDDFGLHVNNHRWIGHDLRGELGSGGPRIELSNVNGRIEIRHANDGRTVSTVKDLSRQDRDDDKDDDGDEI